jgi:hypothetical protein
MKMKEAGQIPGVKKDAEVSKEVVSMIPSPPKNENTEPKNEGEDPGVQKKVKTENDKEGEESSSTDSNKSEAGDSDSK